MNETLKYKGYTGSIEISKADKLLYGKVLNVNSLISYEGKTVEELEADFKGALDEYLEDCKEMNVSPEKPFKGSFNVRVRPELHRELALAALNSGQTLNKFVADSLEKACNQNKHRVVGA